MRQFPGQIGRPLIGAAALLLLSTPAHAQTPAAPVATAAEQPIDALKSLFDPSDNTVVFAGRGTSVAGDEARYQRYQDLGAGFLVTGARLLRKTADWQLNAGADNVAWRDQRFFADYEKTGLFKLRGFWDEIPQFYSVETKTPYTAKSTGVLVLDDATQQAIQNKTQTLSAYVPLAPQFDLRERRAIGTVGFSATPTKQLEFTGGYTTTKHSGELPWGASFGFSNDVEVPLPYESRTNDFDVAASWNDTKSMLRVGFTSSHFDNQAPALTWDSPLQLTDTTSAPGSGRMTLWPSNSMRQLSTAGYRKLAHKTQVTGSLSFGWFNNDTPLLPHTVNSALPIIQLPRAGSEGHATTLALNVGLVSRPKDDWRFSTKFRSYGYNNNAPKTSITDYVAYDSKVSQTPTGGPDLFAHDRNTFDADATYTGLGALALTMGYTNNHDGRDFRTFQSTNENVLQLKADAAGPMGMMFRAHYEFGSRTGSGLDESTLTSIGEQPSMRQYDLANRSRNKFTGQIDLSPREDIVLSFSGGFGSDDYPDSGMGLQEASFNTFSSAIDYQTPVGANVGGNYNYERYSGLQRSRTANPPPDAQFTDPNRNWMVDTKETVHYFSLYVQLPKFAKGTETRASYNFSNAAGNQFYTVGSALPPPSQLPDTYNKLQNLTLDARHRLSGRLAATFTYVFEPFRVYDYAFDSSVVDGIVQPSSLVLGYTYRPYTAHTVLFGIQYFWK